MTARKPQPRPKARRSDATPGGLWPLCTTCSQRPCSPRCATRTLDKDREAVELQAKGEDAYYAPVGHVVRDRVPSKQGGRSSPRSD